MSFSQDIVIERGASFDPVGWVLTGDDGPLRSTAGLAAEVTVRKWRGSPAILAKLPCSVQMHTYPGRFDGLPVAVVQLDAMSAEQTAALSWARGVFSVVVNGDYRGGGRVAAPRVAA